MYHNFVSGLNILDLLNSDIGLRKVTQIYFCVLMFIIFCAENIYLKQNYLEK